MLRICRESLNEENGKFYFKGNLYSGFVYCFDKKGILNTILVVDQGIQIGESDDILDIEEDEMLRVHFDALEQDFMVDHSEPTFIFDKQNHFFDGFVYEFEDGFLIKEIEYYEGSEETPYRVW